MEPDDKSLSKLDMVRKFIRTSCFRKSLIGIALGIAAGFLYFHYIGCKSGSCAITGSPLGSMIAGGLVGFLIADPPCNKSQS